MNRKVTYILLPLLMTLVLTIGQSQSSIRFENITTNEGLSQNDVNCIYQDVFGFMWFGTHDGLNKYDGYDFNVYRPDVLDTNAINSNLIFSITGDSDGNLWIGTTGSGLNYFDRKSEKFIKYRHNPSDPNSLSNDLITSVLLDKKDRLWVGTNAGLNMLDLRKYESQAHFEHYNPEDNPFVVGWNGNGISTIYEDQKGQIWVGGHEGLYLLSHDEHGDYYFQLVNSKVGLPNVEVKSIKEDVLGRLVIGTPTGLFAQGDPSQNASLYHAFEGRVDDFEINGTDIWVGTNNGLFHFDYQPKELPTLINEHRYDPTDDQSLSKNVVISLLKDYNNVIWIGTNGGGINKFDPQHKRFNTVRKTEHNQSLSYDKIRSMLEDSHGNMWVGTEGGGLNVIDSKSQILENNNFKRIPDLNKVFAMIEVKSKLENYILIGCEDTPGLYRLDISANKVAKEVVGYPEIDHSVFSLLEDSNKNIWLGTYAKGLHRWQYDPVSHTYQKDIIEHSQSSSDGLSSNIIRSIIEDREGNIWLGTANGLNRITYSEIKKHSPKVDVFLNVPRDSTSLSYNYLLPLYEDSDGDIWIGTFGGGLNKLVPATEGGPEHFVTYTEDDGLSNNVIKAIQEDNSKNLWLSTNRGLSRFDKRTGEFKNYDINDGLQSNEFQELASYKKANGQLLFGGVNGYNYFFPKDIKDNDKEAETVFTRLTISNEEVNAGQDFNGRKILSAPIAQTNKIELKHFENSFSIEFAGLHYAAPLKNQFAYRLEGFNDEWVYTNVKKRFATYTNLRSGSYTLSVKASNNDGLWDSTPRQLQIVISPPFWLTYPAYGLYALVIGLVLWGFRRYTIISTTEKHELQLEHLEKTKHEEVQRMKLEFFTNISHELRTPLTLIRGPLEYLQKNEGQLDPSIVKEQYHLMQKNTSYLMRLINQLLDFRKMEQGKMRLLVKKSDAIGFIKEVCEPFQFLAHKKGIKYDCSTSYKEMITWFDPDALEKVMYNLLSNAFKFTPEDGQITISIGVQEGTSDKDGHLKVMVSDSGSGIPPHHLEHIFERFYIQQDKSERNKQGAGLGLSFSKNLIELHQGQISVESSEERGTTFTFILPISKSAYVNVPNVQYEDDEGHITGVHPAHYNADMITHNDEILDQGLSRKRSKMPVLLVVDDNPDIRTFVRRSLASAYNIIEAENGQEALDKTKEVVPNIILSDILMPVMDGLEFCQHIRSNSDTSHIPILILSAKSSQESELEVLNSGADDYLRKPFNMDLLQFKLAHIIEQRDQLRKKFNRDVTLQPSEVTVTTKDQKFLEQAIEIVEQHMSDTELSVEKLAREIGFSRSNLYLKFKELTGLSSSEFIRSVRLKRAVELFDKSDYSVKEIMYMTGFSTASYFSKCFKKQFGMTPTDYIKQKDVSVDL